MGRVLISRNAVFDQDSCVVSSKIAERAQVDDILRPVLTWYHPTINPLVYRNLKRFCLFYRSRDVINCADVPHFLILHVTYVVAC